MAATPAEQMQDNIFRAMSPAERLGCAFSWTRLTYDMMLAGIRAQRPDLAQSGVAAEIRRRSLPDLSHLISIMEPSMNAGSASESFGVPHQFVAVIGALERSAIPYALTGSLACIVWGRPRATYDADFVIALREAEVDRLVRAFPSAEWYFDREMLLEAIRFQSECHAIHMASATKVDFWIKKNRPADAIRFSRRRREKLVGVDCWVLAPEDTILAKLEWSAAAPSERQAADIRGMLEIQAWRLDLDYIRHWADALGVRTLLEDRLAESP